MAWGWTICARKNSVWSDWGARSAPTTHADVRSRPSYGTPAWVFPWCPHAGVWELFFPHVFWDFVINRSHLLPQPTSQQPNFPLPLHGLFFFFFLLSLSSNVGSVFSFLLLPYFLWAACFLSFADSVCALVLASMKEWDHWSGLLGLSPWRCAPAKWVQATVSSASDGYW